MNHKNFVFTLVLIFTRCLEIVVHNLSNWLIINITLFSSYRLFLISNFTSLSFLKLVNELLLLHLFTHLCVRLLSSVSHYHQVTPSFIDCLPWSDRKYFEELFRFTAADAVYLKKTESYGQDLLKPRTSTEKLVSKLAPKRRCSSHTFRYGYLVTT